jgi:DNA invertase Pin-like site-specific DNA recombinase
MSPPKLGPPADALGRPSGPPTRHPELIHSPARPPKIQPWHLERLAIVYVRQSSPYQVMHHKESAEVQAKLRELAIAWGWPPDRVIVITGDQARSGTSTDGRDDLLWVMTEVNLDHVGIILGFQVSRLSRANKDWYDLLERCALFDTLLADQDGVYSPTLYNDRLLLGFKGTMSEAELHLLQQRLYHGRLNKARRGELFTLVPTGYIRLPGDRIALDPDEQVQHVVRLIFDKFDELGSVGAVLRYLLRHDIKLGVRVHGGPDAGRLDWRPALRTTLNKIVRRPIYAGCYVFGFHHDDPRRKKPGHPGSGRVRVEPMTWEVMIPDKVPAYITWERYWANQDRLAANRCLPTTPGAPRGGPALLGGLVYCGRCGRRMRVAYHAEKTPVYYLCNYRFVECAEPICQSLAGGPLEALVTAEVLQALEPAELELSLQAIADLEHERNRLDRHWQHRRERARIEAERAARQYHACEPENRLVARELERRWEQALQEQRGLEEEYDRFVAETPRELTAADRRAIAALAAKVPELWHDAHTPIQDRQAIIRSLVERITVAVRGRTEWVDVTIGWFGGLETRYEIRRPVRKYEQLSNYKALRARMVELRRGGATTEAIAVRLNREGFYPSHGPAQFNRHVVNQFLRRQGLLGPGLTRRLNPEDLRPHEWRLSDLARELGMPAITLRHWHYRGWVLGRKSAEVGGCWILWADAEERDRLRRLRAWHPEGPHQARPPVLTTPKRVESEGPSEPKVRSSRSRREAPKSKRSTYE